MSHFAMTTSFLPRHIFGLNRTLHQTQYISCRLCSTDGGGGGKNDSKKLNDILASLKVKPKKQPTKPIGLKAKPIRKNISKSSSSSSSSDSDGELGDNLVSVTKNLAKSTAKNLKGKNDDDKEKLKVTIETDLSRKLKEMALGTRQSRQKSEVKGETPGNQQADILMNMKVQPKEKKDVKPFKPPELTEEQKQFMEKMKKRRQEKFNKQIAQAYVPINLFEAEKPLEIFQPVQNEESSTTTILKTWHAISDREMRILTAQPPRNLIEDMANMTDKGILWHFPINNEQGINEEEMDSFIEHVFLERHIESWCPESGPLRDFMEAVCTTLSKNAFMTAEKKLEYINWFRDYFDQPDQKDILTISGVLDG